MIKVGLKSADGHAVLEWRNIDAWHDWAALREGCYLLCRNVADWNDEDLWKVDIHLIDAETAF
ncbi:MAG: hypothetical protein ABSG67_06090 [Thermoguttaceae bacterium]